MARITQPITPYKPAFTLRNATFEATASGPSGSFLAMSDDGAVVYGRRGGTGLNWLYRSTDMLVTQTNGINFDGIAGTGSNVKSALFTNDGELLVSVSDSAGHGLWRSQGIAGGTPTWTRVQEFSTQWNDVRPYGWDKAPPGHPASGVVVACEYGPQSQQGVTPIDGGSSRVWVSEDHGRTWREVFNLLRTYGTHNLHMHGACYDRHSDCIVICFGDGYAGGAARTGTLSCANWRDGGQPVWTPVGAEPAASSAWQATLIRSVDVGLVIGSDGPPDGIWVARRNGRAYRKPTAVAKIENNGCIGTVGYQRHPGLPLLVAFQGGGTSSGNVSKVWAVSPSGATIEEAWRDTATIGNWGGVMSLVGPDRSGKVGWFQSDSRGAGLTRVVADLVSHGVGVFQP